MSHAVKRKELKLGETYVVMEKVPGYGPRSGHNTFSTGVPATIAYRRVHLIELRSGNRAVVQFDIQTYDRPMFAKGRQTVTRTVLREVSCSTFLALASEWDERGHVFDIKARHCVLAPPKPAVDNLAGQQDIGGAA